MRAGMRESLCYVSKRDGYEEKSRIMVHGLFAHVEAATRVAESIQGDWFELVKFGKYEYVSRAKVKDGN